MPIADFSGTPLTGSAPLTVVFTDLSTTPSPTTITNWSWTFGDGGTANGNAPADIDPQHQYTSAGTYTVTLTVTNDLGNTSTKPVTGYVVVTTPLCLVPNFTAQGGMPVANVPAAWTAAGFVGGPPVIYTPILPWNNPARVRLAAQPRDDGTVLDPGIDRLPHDKLAAMNRTPNGRRERGQGLAEFALVLPLILLTIFAILDLGRAVYAYSTIGNAARTGSRVAIVDQNIGLIQTRASEQAVALGIAPADVIVTYLESDLSGPCSPSLRLGCVAEVTVPYDFTAVTPVISNIVGTLSMSSTTRFPIERVYSTP